MVIAIDGLTPKQSKFADCLFMGMTQADAYRTAYDCENWSNEAIYVEASRVADLPNVILRLKELKAIADTQIGLSMAEKRGICKEIASNHDLRPRDRLQAVDIDNKQMRVYVDSTPNTGQSFTFQVLIAGQDGNQVVNAILTGKRKELSEPAPDTAGNTV